MSPVFFNNCSTNSISRIGALRLVPRFFTWFGLLFFFLMLVLPTTYQIERGVLLAVLLVGVFIFSLKGGWRINKTIAFLGLTTITASAIFITIGFVNNTPGALRVATVFVLWPMVFLFLMGALSNPDQMRSLMKVIIVGAIVSAFMAMALLVEKLFKINLGMSVLLEIQGGQLSVYNGFIEYRLFNMNTVIYALPFLLGILFMPYTWSLLKGAWRYFAWVALALSVLTLIISGRRAFWLITAMSPFVVLALLWLGGLRPRVSKLVIKIILIILIFSIMSVALLNLDFHIVWLDFLKGFDFSNVDSPSAFRRQEQFKQLLNGWLENPFLGAGHGATVDVNPNNRNLPWAYELSYLALLFQTGLIGILIYGSAVAWIFFKGLKMVRRSPDVASLLIPTLAGLACFLVANITNPYLQKFDYLWTIFLPIGVINACLLKNR